MIEDEFYLIGSVSFLTSCLTFIVTVTRSRIVFGGNAMPTNHIPASQLGQALAFGHRELIRLNPEPLLLLGSKTSLFPFIYQKNNMYVYLLTEERNINTFEGFRFH